MKLRSAFFAGALFLARGLFADVPHWTREELSSLERGAKGYGETVFYGYEPQRFEVEFQGISDSMIGPRVNVRLSGGPENIIESVTVPGGISGSPVFFPDASGNDKFLGVIAYGEEYQSAPDGEVVPFFLSHEEERRVRKFKNRFPARQAEKVSENDSFKPGVYVKIGLVAGSSDFSDNVGGSVMAIDEEAGTVYLLGHPMLVPPANLPQGPVSYPVWRAGVAATIPNFRDSHKISSRIEKGQHARAWYNGLYGVYATLDEDPEMIPLRMSVSTDGVPVRQPEELLLPYGPSMLASLGATVLNFLDAYVEPMGDSTVLLDGTIAVRGEEQPIKIRDHFVNNTLDLEPFSKSVSAKSFYFGAVKLLLDADRPIGKVRFDELRIDFTVGPAENALELQKMVLLNDSAAPGETISVALLVNEKYGLSGSRKRYPFVIKLAVPPDAVPGSGRLYVETGISFSDRRNEDAPASRTIQELISRIRANAATGNRLYFSLELLGAPSDGSSTDSEGVSMPLSFENPADFLVDLKDSEDVPGYFHESNKVAIASLEVRGSNSVVVINNSQERFEESVTILRPTFGATPSASDPKNEPNVLTKLEAAKFDPEVFWGLILKHRWQIAGGGFLAVVLLMFLIWKTVLFIDWFLKKATGLVFRNIRKS